MLLLFSMEKIILSIFCFVLSITDGCYKEKLIQIEFDVCEWKCPNGVKVTDKNAAGKCQELCKKEAKYEQECCDGYARDLQITDSPCLDIDECSELPPRCHPLANFVCVNKNGSYNCACQPGFYRPSNDSKQCLDINECERYGICDYSAVCENLPGSFRCICPPGFQEIWDVSRQRLRCQDIDECEDKMRPSPCPDSHKICLNNIGSYTCVCSNGYEKAPDGDYCKDIDECNRGLHTCNLETSDCVNSDGGYECICKAGFARNATLPPYDHFTCFDVDECFTGNIVCPENFTCLNTPGSFRCAPFCLPGYRKYGKNGCLDINECAEGTHLCSHYCHNEAGTYSCSCPILYRLDYNQHICEYGQIGDEVFIVLIVAVGLVCFSTIICVCFCANRIYGRHRLRTMSPNRSELSISKPICYPNTPVADSSFYMSIKRNQQSTPAAAVDQNHSSNTSSASGVSKLTRSSLLSSSYRAVDNDMLDVPAPDYATAVRVAPRCYHYSNEASSSSGNRRYYNTVGRMPPPQANPYWRQSYQRPLSTSGLPVPVLPVNGRFLTFGGRPYSATITGGIPVDIPDFSRRPVLLPRYASTDDESPIVCLLDDNDTAINNVDAL